MKPLVFYLKNPRFIGLGLLWKFAKYIHNDRVYLKLLYYFELGKRLDLNHPKTFNEKLNWLKLYNRKSEYTMMVDKYAVKEYVANKIGEEYVIPTLGVWNTPEEIDFDGLPNQFVLKTTHGGGGGGVLICRDKLTFNCEEAIAKLNRVMKADIYTAYREWPYKNISRKIIAEKYMVDESGQELKNNDLVDYKFFCFNGEPRLCQVISDRRTNEKIDFYDMQWNRIDGLIGLNYSCHNSTYQHIRPKQFDKMKVISAKLAKNIPFLRIDLYEINGHCYFGEITFYPAGGVGFFKPIEWNEKIGSWIFLPTSNC